MSKKNKLKDKNDKIVKSVNNNIRSSVRKLNPILKSIVGKKVDIAIRNLTFSEKRISKDVKKTIGRGKERSRASVCVNVRPRQTSPGDQASTYF